MTNFEYAFMVSELSPLILGRHFDRIRKIGEGIYRMKIGSTEILCECGVRIHSTKYIEKTELTDKFVEKISKELDNAKLLSIEQINNDRILCFNFTKGQLIFEMFGEGNVILVRDGNTVCAQKYESWSDRAIRVGESYSPPKNIPSNKLEFSDRYIIVSLMKIPLGKDYCLEALARSKIDEKTPGTSLSGNQILALEQALDQIRSNPKPYGFYSNGKMCDFGLSSMKKYSEQKDFPSLSEVADEYYMHLEKSNPVLDKLIQRLEKQKERLAALLEEEREYKQKGDHIYEHFQEVESLLNDARTGKIENIKINKKDRSIELEL